MDATDEHPAADYRQAPPEDALRAHGYRAVTVLGSVGSTNTWLAEHVARRSPEGTAAPALEAVVTGFQSQGRGRLDRQWVTPPGTAVTFSVACTPVDRAGRPWPQELVPWLTLLMAHSITTAVRELTGVPAVVKWPNDVLVADRKLCGILASLVAAPARGAPTVVVGAGINVAQEQLPVATATSLRLEADDAAPTRPELLTAVLVRFAEVLERASSDPAGQLGAGGGLRRAVEDGLNTLGRQVTVHLPGSAAPVVATAVGLGTSGQLVVRTADGAHHEYSAGDVVHVRPAPAAAEEGQPANPGRGAEALQSTAPPRRTGQPRDVDPRCDTERHQNAEPDPRGAAEPGSTRT